MRFHAEKFAGSGDFATFYEALPYSSQHKETEVCALLQVTPQTLRRYLSGKVQPPRAAVALLFHESHIGRAVLDEHAHRGMLYAQNYAKGLESSVKALQARIAALDAELLELRSAAQEPRRVAINDSFYRLA